jgi:hypothetical protein
VSRIRRVSPPEFPGDLVVTEEQKEPPRYKRGGHWVNLFLLIAGFVVTRPAISLYRLNPEKVDGGSRSLPTAQ